MSLVRLGSDYGGWWVDLGLIKDGDTILDCGVGYDLTFAEALLARRKVKVVGVDPSRAVQEYVRGQQMPASYEFILAAAAAQDKVRMYYSNRLQGSESVRLDHRNVDGVNSYYEARGVRPKSLITPETSLVKLDIEGSEFDVYQDCFGVKQVCIEFHHAGVVASISEKDTYVVVDAFRVAGYEIARVTENREYLFIAK